MFHLKISVKSMLDKKTSKDITIIMFLKHFAWEMITKIKIQDIFYFIESF